jgi:hypothetical protein
MKKYQFIKRAAVACAVAALALVCSTNRTQAQTIIIDYTNTFDNNGQTSMYLDIGWMYWYSLYQDCFGAGYNLSMTNDPTMDADGNTNVSGSLYVVSPFAVPGALAPGAVNPEPSYGEQSLISGTFGGGQFDTSVQMKILTVTNISFKIHVLPGTPTDANGNFGGVYIGLKSIGYGADTSYYTNLVTIPGAATNGWVTIAETNAAQFQYAANSSGDTYAQGPEIYYNQYGKPYPTNLVIFWIDDLVVNSSVAPPPPPPPPTMSISPAVPGLNLFTGTGTSLYNRENIESTSGSYTWVGASQPVSFSFTITNYPVGTNDAVQTQIFLVPNPGTESDPDWNEANCVFLDLENQLSVNGGANWTFHYKTNDANDNAMVYNTNPAATNSAGKPIAVGTLASITNTTALGTWTVTFNQNTNVTMTTPSGTSTNFSIPDATGATSALFASDVYLYFGVQAGNTGGANDHIVASEFKVTGSENDFDDNFVADDGALNTSYWITNAAYPVCVQMVAPGDPPYWIQWTEPAPGFILETTPSLSTDIAWTQATNHSVFIAGTNFTQLVSSNDLPVGNTAFLALVQRNYTQLQVLLPGETAAPNTLTGKTGTPTPVSLGTNNEITVTVNAVDSKWNIVPTIKDTVAISSTDASAYSNPASAVLVNGTGQYSVYFETEGNQTVTAKDAQASITGTSAAVSVGP